jgi:hypothetical protein
VSKKASASFNASLSKTPNKRNVAGESFTTKKTPAKTPKKSPSKEYMYKYIYNMFITCNIDIIVTRNLFPSLSKSVFSLAIVICFFVFWIVERGRASCIHKS